MDSAPPAVPDPHASRPRMPIAILGVPFDNLTTDETVELIARMIASGQPHYLATANVDFVVQALEDVELRRILFDAHAVLADGMPIVWASRQLGNPLPERVTGSDLVPRLLAEAEQRGWRVFLLGGTTESVAQAADNSLARHPRLHLVGAYSPPFKPLLEMDHGDILRRVSAARPDLLLVAFGCPKQEKWINMHYRHLGVPVSIGVGATIDFLAGTVRRAPPLMQKTGTEWIYRLVQEPGRLATRYGKDLRVFSQAIVRQAALLRSWRASPGTASPPVPVPPADLAGPAVLPAPERIDAAHADALGAGWSEKLRAQAVILDLTATRFIDSTGVGLLVRLQKLARELGRDLVLAGVGEQVRRALALMKLGDFFDLQPDVAAARARVGTRPPPATVLARAASGADVLRLEGDLTAATVAAMAESAETRLAALEPGTSVTLDLAGIPFLDSSGVGLLVRLKKRAWERNVAVRAANPTPAVANVLRLTRVDEFLLGHRL